MGVMKKMFLNVHGKWEIKDLDDLREIWMKQNNTGKWIVMPLIRIILTNIVTIFNTITGTITIIGIIITNINGTVIMTMIGTNSTP